MAKKKAAAHKARPSSTAKPAEGRLKGDSSVAKKKSKQLKHEKVYKGTTQWEQLSNLGLHIRPVTADGNCFFRAVADQVEGSQDGHSELRARCVDYMEAHADDFRPFVEDDVSFEEYCRNMRDDATWAGHMEVQATSLLLRRNLCIHWYQAPRWNVRNFNDAGVPTLHLSYHDGEHYNSVRLQGDTGTGPAAPICIEGDERPSPKPPPSKDKDKAAERPSGKSQAAAIRFVRSSTGCEDDSRICQVLEEVGGDADAAIECLIAAQATKGAGAAGGDGDGPPCVDGNGIYETCTGSAAGSLAPEPLDQRRQPGGREGEMRPAETGPGETRRQAAASAASKASETESYRVPVAARNKPCPCGSGKKYKACCGAQAAPQAAAPPETAPASQGPTRPLTGRERKQQIREARNAAGGLEPGSPRKDLGSLCI